MVCIVLISSTSASGFETCCAISVLYNDFFGKSIGEGRFLNLLTGREAVREVKFYIFFIF